MKHIILTLALLAFASATVNADNIPPVPRPIPYNSPLPTPTPHLSPLPAPAANVVALSGVTAEIDGIQARDIVLLTLIAVTLLLVRWAISEGKRGN